tara:strand:+ start:267 stop:569 length:303 start_codon:yes stop_codon:yes gene_type:complete
MELNNKTLEIIYKVLDRAELCMDDYMKCVNEIVRLDALDTKKKPHLGDNSMETIARSLKKLELEMGFGIKNDENKQQESKRETVTELCEGYIEGTISTTT